MNAIEFGVTVIGLAAITLLTRGFFIVPEREWPMPEWLREALRYAPIGALVALVAPEIVMSQGHLINTWCDARLFGALAATGWFVWRRELLGTIVAGTAVMLILSVGLGW
jgi:branched-subunit amino acid transport protein